METNASARRAFATGFAFAITAGIGYAACAIAFWAWPDAAMTFMSSLFHGLDFRKLQVGGAFHFGSFSLALAVMAIWAFVLGTVFGWLADRLRAA